MTSRLESVPMTPEDAAVWEWVYLHWPGMRFGQLMLFSLSRDQDMRDAELMLRLGRFWRLCDDMRVRHLQAAYQHPT